MIVIKLKNYFWALFAVICIIMFFLIKPIIQTIFIAGILAYLFYPLYSRVNKKLKNDSVSAVIVIAVIMLVIGIVVIFLIISLISQMGVFYRLANVALEDNLVSELVQDTMSRPELSRYTQNLANQATSVMIRFVYEILISIPKILLALVLIIFLLYYAFKDGKKFVDEIEKFIPIRKSHKRKIIKKLDDTLHATIYGTIVVAFVQAFIASIGFYVLGVRAPFVFGLLTFFASMIPFIGAVAVWAPLGSIMIIWAYMTNGNILPGVGVLLYGFLVISVIDNILKPKLIGDRAEIHPVLILIGITGGILIFGFTGMFIGPIITALFKAMFEIYKKEGLKWT